MICIILVAGHDELLEKEIKSCPEYVYLRGVPKALLPGAGGKKILDFWWEAIRMRQLFSEIYLVTNADKYKHYERWATASDFPVENIINDGTTTFENRIGAVADFDLVLRIKNVNDDVMVVAGDMLFQDQKFDVQQVLNYFQLKKSNLAIYYEMEPEEVISSRGIVEVTDGNKIAHFYEKPLEGITESRLASVVFYCFHKDGLTSVKEFLDSNIKAEERSFGKYMDYLINTKGVNVYGMKLPTGFQLIGHVGLDDYKRWSDVFSHRKQIEDKIEPYTKRAYARVGLMGNPSDGFHGKTISLSIANFWAEVTIHESEKLVLTPHPLNDPTEFGSMADLHGISRKEGYLGGLRLLQATCMRFYQYCCDRGIALAKRNFTLKYDTNIPRQVGLAGSSAIVTATLGCLMHFFNLTYADMPKEKMPQFILDVEKQELIIHAGLQDRVIQVYEGLVYMDFSLEIFEAQGFGNYSHIEVNHLPHFWLAYLGDPSDSGKIHSDVNLRWKNKDKDVIEAMKKFALLTDQAKVAFQNHDWSLLADLMNQNFEIRRSIYSDLSLGAANLRMIEIARQFGSAVKFPGSGGAVIGLCVDTSKIGELKAAFQAEGCVFCDIIPHGALDA
ncbi:hypothetical protein CAPTEDRAFT_174475 [Capitella teleta]|uniref:Nucleotidyl transferase domain-containing protein n=1 Tax=Capitella teleta TaxID=283909 RepID=R7U016_CAPTE|nr:hypothetical protein CAPTEDRAFT_174475 [Capitella teleta]|eukprot:ELT97006.1 hypothetical protein CAPTEDRAFT_174475 [Capitella teleta]